MPYMQILVGIVGILIILVILQDAFETVILPRRITRSFRLARYFYKSTWTLWSGAGRKIRSINRKEYYLSLYGPLSLIVLLILWAIALVFGYAMLQFAFGSSLQAPEKFTSFGTDLYMSGTTFFTLGLGDVTPTSMTARILAVVESGNGLGFLALVIGYLPVIYQAFSRREVGISLLDSHAGSPPSAGELLKRHSRVKDMNELIEHLREWEHWSAEMLESHLSYPVLMYYRSQHEHQSWLSSLTTILDVCALITISIDGTTAQSAWFTFAIARHAAVDLSQVFRERPKPVPEDQAERLSHSAFISLCESLKTAGVTIHNPEGAEQRLAELREMYEPYVNTLSSYLQMPLPAWLAEKETVDNWQTSAWGHVISTSAL